MSMETPPFVELKDDQDPAELEPELLTDEELDAVLESEGEAEAVTYQGTDFDAEGLVRRLDRKDIVIPSFGHGDDEVELASFQRSFVWTRPQMDRFIESLLLGFPVPGIMLVQQSDKRYLVLDGQQRLRTLQAFYNGIHRQREFALENVAEEFRGLTYKTLLPAQKRVLDNSFIQATIVKTDGTAESRESVYQIFERLNSGGTQLTPHEIRIALYPGQFVDFLGELNGIDSWRNIYGSVSPRVRDHELLLRVVALYVSSEEYFRPLKRFLNTFLGRHRTLDKLSADDIRHHFTKAINALDEAGARDYLRPPRARLNVATFDAVMVGAMRRVAASGVITAQEVEAALDLLREDAEFADATSTQTDTEENVRNRLRIATAAFAK
ncbi:DUF262 domain-containing protein [Microbacterium sp. W4I20]|uniref:DUF262 domain-containing protein n=1 Tax=Microbacterium sp. W4I20 TaxID=3042262 RepID=UPI002785EDAF|nr:DUF262 domain-containing protein [Microbacterium sp. W4I20]MDQ0726051.1 hypothetical protein [Microbacterium sp. W4I20]